MKTLNESRAILNEIDPMIKELFIKRMLTVKDVILYKMEHDLPVLDKVREQELKERLLSDIDDELKPYYNELLDTILKVSKDYQESIKNSYNK